MVTGILKAIAGLLGSTLSVSDKMSTDADVLNAAAAWEQAQDALTTANASLAAAQSAYTTAQSNLNASQSNVKRAQVAYQTAKVAVVLAVKNLGT